MADLSRRHAPGHDRGFTLTEVLIVVVLLGLLSLAIGAVFSVIVRTLPSTEARVDDARSLLGLSTWLPADVNSTPRIPVGTADTPSASFDTRPTASSGCAGGDDGINLLRLTWTESYTATTTYSTSYRLVERNSGWHIVRVACTNAGGPSILNTTSALAPPDQNPAQVTYKVDDGEIIGVEFLVTTIDGGTLRIDTVSQNPDATLPPLGDVDLDPTTTTEPAPTTTTIPATADAVCSLLTDPSAVTQVPTPATSPLLRHAGDGFEGELTSAVAVDAVLVFTIDEDLDSLTLDPEWCTTLRLAYDTGTTAVAAPMYVEATCSSDPLEETCTELTVEASFVLPSHESELWTSGLHDADLVDGTGASIAGTATQFAVDVDPATVPATCTASFVSVDPPSVHNTNNENSNNTSNVTEGALYEEVTVTVSKGDNCDNLGLEYEHSPGSIGWKPFGASSQVILHPSNQESWLDGSRPLRLRDGQTGTVLATTTLEIL